MGFISNIFSSCVPCHVKTKAEKAEKQLNDVVSVFQRYKFTTVIGSGGCAEVWSAVDKNTGEVVAIKMTDAGHTADWMAKEYSIMKKFDSPYVARPEAFMETKKASFMVMKKYGGSLFDLIQTGPTVGEELKHVVKQVATGLKTIHDAGYVHRDIKPENVLMDDHGNFAIADFGMAESDNNMTVHSMMGTGSYMAPEIAEGVLRPEKALLTVGKPVDVYALGQVIYTLITQRNAIPQGTNTKEVIRNNLRFDMRFLIDELDIRTDLKDLLYGMTARNPVSRMTIDEVLDHRFLL
jgi:hypothetical protein